MITAEVLVRTRFWGGAALRERDELSSRLSRRQFCRRAQAWRAGAHPDASARRSRRRFASSTPTPAPAATTWPARKRAAAANGARASSVLWAGATRRRVGGTSNLAPYLDAVAAFNPDGRLRIYPGSPLIAARLLRPQDRLIACELEPKAPRHCLPRASRRPARQGAGDRRLDRARRLCAAEGAARAGPDRPAVRGARPISTRLSGELAVAHRKWPTGIYLLWYPIKDRERAGRAGAAAAKGLALPIFCAAN